MNKLVPSVLFFGTLISLGGCNSGSNQSTTPTYEKIATAKISSQKQQTATTGDNFYISYYSPEDVSNQVKFQHIAGSNTTIIWEMSGDVDPEKFADLSLIRAIKKANPTAYSVAFWADWSIYHDDRALPYTPYFISGAIGTDGQPISNEDFDNKARWLDAINYSFLEVDQSTGTAYFNDPWADLTPNDPFCANGDNPICAYSYTSQGRKFSAQYGNFEAFAKYKKINGSVPIDRYISIGGYGHDGSFEGIFGNAEKIERFVSSIYSIVDYYNLTGVDLDYENPNMTPEQSAQYYQVVQALNDKFYAAGKKYKITITVLSSPDYLTAAKGVGFNNMVLKGLSSLPQVKSINLMTYDYYGAFNYTPDNNGRTGFLTNIYLPNNAPAGSINFSTETAVNALLAQGVNSAKIGTGIPTYGRALQGIDNSNGLFADSNYTGLYATIPSTAYIPRGDLDSKSCDQEITPLTLSSCSGSYTYKYILGHFNNDNGFTIVDWKNNSQNLANGTTAYISNCNDTNYTLEVTNLSNNLGVQITSINNGSVSIGSLDWLNVASTGANDKVYDANTTPSVSTIQGATGLITHWEVYQGGPAGDCPAFDFTANMHIMINPETGACDVKPM